MWIRENRPRHMKKRSKRQTKELDNNQEEDKGEDK